MEERRKEGEYLLVPKKLLEEALYELREVRKLLGKQEQPPISSQG